MKRTVAFTKNATNVFFHILTACNLSCRHCYINPEQHGTKTLPIDTIISWLTPFAQKTNQANVVFLGGEPTLHPELPKAVKAAREMGYQSITIDTNGYLFNDILSKLCPDDLDFLSFSLDGPTRGVNDRIRGKGSYDTCLAGIRKAVAKGFHTSLITTVSSENITVVNQMPPLLKELGIERFFIQVIGVRGKTAQPPSGGTRPVDLQVSAEEWLKIIPAVAEKAARLGMVVSYPKVFLSLDEPFACAGTEAENYFIFPNGRVYRCPLCEDYPLNGFVFKKNRLVQLPKITETDFFSLRIPEGCVMNKIIQPGNLLYAAKDAPAYKVACCMLKEEIGAYPPVHCHN
jgi:Fe-coproporphyrin III synthase